MNKLISKAFIGTTPAIVTEQKCYRTINDANKNKKIGKPLVKLFHRCLIPKIL